MKKTNMDLIVGGSILISLVILIGGVLWLKDASIASKKVCYSVLFQNVGTLQIGDPVKVNGVNKGAVSDIFLRNDNVAVVIEVEKSVKLNDSCKFSVQNIGLMGERGIGIEFSNKGKTLYPNKKGDSTFITGSFDPGIAEAMAMLGTVLLEVETLVGNVNTIVQTTVGDSVFISLFKTLVQRLDTITDVTQSIILDNKPVIDNSFRNIQSISTDLKGILDKNSDHIDAIMNNGDSLSAYTVSIAAQVGSLTQSVKSILDQVESGNGSLGMFINDKQLYLDLKQTLGDLDTLINQVQGDALKLRIKLGFGKKKK